MTALYLYANGWNKEGVASFSCEKCTEDLKEMLGCGYEVNFAGKSALKETKHNLRGICPGWWRTQPYVLDVLCMARWKENLGHPKDIPNRLVQSLLLLNSYEIEASIARSKEG